jgi:sulfur-carrier protein
MATVHFTSNLRRHVDCPSVESTGTTVRAVLEGAFATNPRLRSYVLDDQGGVRKHMRVLVDGQAIVDREHLSDVVKPAAQVWVMQALSGG